jgi:hypothetical protein
MAYQQPPRAHTGYNPYFEYREAKEARETRLGLLQQKCESIDMDIFLLSVFPRSPSLVNFVNALERTMIGQHVFTKQPGNIILHMTTGGRVLTTRQEPGCSA